MMMSEWLPIDVDARSWFVSNKNSRWKTLSCYFFIYELLFLHSFRVNHCLCIGSFIATNQLFDTANEVVQEEKKIRDPACKF